jgi:hypothetical protein
MQSRRARRERKKRLKKIQGFRSSPLENMRGGWATATPAILDAQHPKEKHLLSAHNKIIKKLLPKGPRLKKLVK